MKKAEDLLFGALPGIKFALGENPKRPGAAHPQTPRRYPDDAQGVEYVIRDAFTRAKAYQKPWQELQRGEDRRPRRHCRRGAISQLDALVEILEGKRLVHCTAIAPTRS